MSSCGTWHETQIPSGESWPGSLGTSAVAVCTPPLACVPTFHTPMSLTHPPSTQFTLWVSFWGISSQCPRTAQGKGGSVSLLPAPRCDAVSVAATGPVGAFMPQKLPTATNSWLSLNSESGGYTFATTSRGPREPWLSASLDPCSLQSSRPRVLTGLLLPQSRPLHPPTELPRGHTYGRGACADVC